MTDSDMVDVLAELAEKLGLEVRWEGLIGEGGICTLRGKRYLLVKGNGDLPWKSLRSVLIDKLTGSRQGEDLVTTILNHGSASVSEELLYKQLLGYTHSPEQLDRFACHLESGVCAYDRLR